MFRVDHHEMTAVFKTILMKKGCNEDIASRLIAIDPRHIGGTEFSDRIIQETLESIKASGKSEDTDFISYPGERTLRTRQDNLKNGIPVEETLWSFVRNIMN